MIMSRFYDVCIIGGGASGLAAAVYIKQRNADISVAVLERLPRVGKKLITTGNGRCNITNADESLSHFHGENPGFAKYAIEKYNNSVIEAFFASIGVPFYYDETGRAYPASLQASSVVDALRFSCDAFGVHTYTECKVSGVRKKDGVYSIKTEKGEFETRNVIFAAGLLSGGARLGCDGGILSLLSSKGERTIKTTPAIVQLKTETGVVRSLKGIKVNANAKLIINGELIRQESGEVLFCDYGLSGPAILQIAREVDRRQGEKYVCLDLMPGKSFDEVVSLLNSLKSALPYRSLDEFLSGALNKRLSQSVIKSSGLKLTGSVSDLTGNDIKNLASKVKNMALKVISTTGFENSQVTAGGLDTTGFCDKTMMSKSQKGVYAVGELLDIDGDCGGYNLHFAFSSAFCAADSIVKGYKND